MNLLLLHNYYLVRGGEDFVFESELEILLSRNSEISLTYFSVNNTSLLGWRRFIVFFSSIFNFTVLKSFKNTSAAGSDSFDVVHVHNFFPIFSPSVFYLFKKKKVSTVLTLHNYRTVCPTSLLMFNGDVCEKSIEGSAWWALRHKVYRESYVGTLALILQIELHKYLGTWQKQVDRFICLTEFSRQKFIQAGYPAHKLVVKPNFVIDPGCDFSALRSANPLFVGRLSSEKGIHVLLESAHWLNMVVDVIGEGEQKTHLNLKYYGKQPRDFVLNKIKSAPFLIVPSTCYEGFPMVIVEAFASGTPVICSRLGSMAEIVADGLTGFHFNPGDSRDLSEKVNYLLANPELAMWMGKNAREEYLQKYTPEKNLEMLIEIYRQAIEETRSK